MQLLSDATDEKGEKLTILETMEIAGMTYAPAAILGIATIACIFGANVLNKRSQATLASAYAFLSESHRKYRKAANSVFGEDADSKIQAEIAKQMNISGGSFAGDSTIYDLEADQKSERYLFYECFSKRYFTSTLSAVMNAQYHINRNFSLSGFAAVNEFYEFLGLDKTDSGDEIGWGQELLEDNTMWIDFDNRYTKLEDGLECYIISTVYEPEYAGF
jgi:hypothetical protein